MRERTRNQLGALAATAIGAAVLVIPATAGAGSLYSGPGPRPGPDILYRKPATSSPQLTNVNPWKAPPILVSGTTAYRNGEFIYQDFLYDDHGANTGPPEPNDPRSQHETVSPPNGRYTYPEDRAYANNAADLVELRVKPLERHTAFRITLNTVIDPTLAGMTIAIGSSDTPRQFPHGANVSAPASHFLTIHGTDADLRRAADGALVKPSPIVGLSMRRRQIEVLVPHKAWNPGSRRVRLAMGVGLWDKAEDRYLIPQESRTETEPGGAGSLADAPAFFNAAFRTREPLPDVQDLQEDVSDTAWWRDSAQGDALAAGDISPFFANVNFAKLHRGITDNSKVPRRGSLDRILVSHFETGQGIEWDDVCGGLEAAVEAGDGKCAGPYRGRLQPYNVYIPKKPTPERGFGMTLLLHALGANYNQYAGSRHQSQFGERAQGSIVITAEARGPDSYYQTLAEAEVFEVWADIARRYRLDPGFASVAGYSMGGMGTFKLAQQFPDLFARAQPTVGTEARTERLASLRNVPILMWNGYADELVNPAFFEPAIQKLDDLGYRYEADVFIPGEHLSLAINDQYQPAADFLGSARVLRNPHHITYVWDPAVDSSPQGIVSDHAYWISKIRLSGAKGTIEAFSHGFGRGDPAPGPTQNGAGTLEGGAATPSYPYTSQSRAWGPTPPLPKRNLIELQTTGISSLSIDVGRARVTCKVKVHAGHTVPLTVRLPGCGRAIVFD